VKSSFRTKLIVFIAGLLCAIQLIDLVSVYVSTREAAFAQAQTQLSVATKVFHRQFDDLTDQLTRHVGVLTLDFGFRETVATGDIETQRSAIQNLGQRVGADRLMLVSLEGDVLIDTRPSAYEGKAVPFLDLFDEADERGGVADIVEIDNTLYRLVMVPILAPIPIAWIAVGIEINDALAERLAEFAALPLHISFATQNAGDFQIRGTTAGPALRAALESSGEPQWRTADAAMMTSFSDELYAIVRTPLLDGSSAKAVAVLQYSLADALEKTKPLLASIIVLLVFGLLIALFGAILIARGVSRPLQALVAGIGRVSKGDYENKISVDAENEFGELADTFNDMMDEIRTREDEITYQASYDKVSGLPNRNEFAYRVGQRLGDASSAAPVALIAVVAMGRLKEVRESLGYNMGDRLIQQIGARYTETLEGLENVGATEPVVARVDGDELGLAIFGADKAACLAVLDRAVQELGEPISLGELVLVTDLKYGVAYSGEHGDDAEDLIRRAEIAMQKAIGLSARVYVFDPENDEADPERLPLIGELRHTIEAGKLELFYQPKLDAMTGKVIGVEGLSRWPHPERGLISPGVFIPLAEQTGDIRLITEWSVNRAIDDLASWRDQGFDLKASVNLTVYDLTDRRLLETLQTALARTKVDPKYLILEITESGLMADPDTAISVLRELSELGFGLSIDDYGTGYSSMSYLKALPVSELKIDQSFVRDIAHQDTDRMIVASTRELAHGLGLSVTAEGVEDQASFDVLKELGCDIVQGYYFARPMPRDEFETFLVESSWQPARI